MKLRSVRFLPAFVLAMFGLVACDALKPKVDLDASVAVPAVTATVNTTATAAPTDTTQPAATTLGGATPAPVAPGTHPVVHTDGGAVHTDGGTAPATPAFTIPTAIPGFDAGALRLPAGFDAGALHNPFQH